MPPHLSFDALIRLAQTIGRAAARCDLDILRRACAVMDAQWWLLDEDQRVEIQPYLIWFALDERYEDSDGERG